MKFNETNKVKGRKVKDEKALRKEFRTQLDLLAEKIMGGAPDEERRDQLVKVLKPLYELCPVKLSISMEELARLGYGNPGSEVEMDFTYGLRPEPDIGRIKKKDPFAEPNPGMWDFDYQRTPETKQEPNAKFPSKAETIARWILECGDNEKTEKPGDMRTCFVMCRISVDNLPKPNSIDSIHSDDRRTVCHVAVGEESVLLTVHRSIREQREQLLVLNDGKGEKWLKGHMGGIPHNYSSTFKLRRADLKAGTSITIMERV